MLYPLAKNVLGQSHINYDRIEIQTDGTIACTGQYGTVVDGAFVPEPLIVRASRQITGNEYLAFTKSGLDSFHAELAAWFTLYGESDSRNTFNLLLG
jgi:hypothetical protein